MYKYKMHWFLLALFALIICFSTFKTISFAEVYTIDETEYDTSTMSVSYSTDAGGYEFTEYNNAILVVTNKETGDFVDVLKKASTTEEKESLLNNGMITDTGQFGCDVGYYLPGNTFTHGIMIIGGTQTRNAHYDSTSQYYGTISSSWNKFAGTIIDDHNSNGYSLQYWFAVSYALRSNCHKENIWFGRNFNCSGTKSLTRMFLWNSNLISLDLRRFDVSSVEDFSYMFQCATNLEEIDVSTWVTSSAKNMSNMFCLEFSNSATKLTSLDLHGFDLRNVITTSQMFSGCECLEDINIGPNFTCENTTNMFSMFYRCLVLDDTEILDTLCPKKVENLQSTFCCAKEIIVGDFSFPLTWDLTNLQKIDGCFTYCSNLTSADLSNLNTPNLQSCASLFENCSGLISADLTGLNISNVTSLYRMFYQDSSLHTLNISNWDTRRVTSFEGTFKNCYYLNPSIISYIYTNSATDITQMFQYAFDGLTLQERDILLDYSHFDFSNVTSEKNWRWSSVFHAEKTISGTVYQRHDYNKGKSDSWYNKHWGEWVTTVEPTCTEEGTKERICTVCGYSETQTINALGHSEGDPVQENYVAPTCTVAGSYDEVTYCSRCGEEMSRTAKVVATLGHTSGEVIRENEVASTCTTKGHYDEVVYCSVCREELSRVEKELPLVEHTPGTPVQENIVNASCHTKGSYDLVTYCTECNTELSRTTIETDKLSHIPNEAIVENNIPATHSASGSYDSVIYCSLCGDELSRTTIIVPQVEHTPGTPVVENVVDATCTEDGHYDSVIYCTGCNAEISRQTITIPKLGHTEGTAIKENEILPTCTRKGSYDLVVYCDRCGEELSRVSYETEKIAHTPGNSVKENEIPATCASKGSYDLVVYCTECGEELSREHIETDVGPHTPGEPVIENKVDKTCAEDGSYDAVTYCEECGTELSRETTIISALGHIKAYKIEEILAPTCEENGINANICYCSECLAELSRIEEEADALGHLWDEGTVTKEATCLEEGIITYTCQRDPNHTKTESVPVLEHIPGDVVIEDYTEPTYTENGHYFEVIRCINCGTELSRNEVILKKLVAPVYVHNHYYELTNHTDPTCTEKGYDTYTCKCGDFYIEETDALGHLPGEEKREDGKEPETGADGFYYMVTYCDRCGVELNRRSEIIPALPEPIVEEEEEIEILPEDDFEEEMVAIPDKIIEKTIVEPENIVKKDLGKVVKRVATGITVSGGSGIVFVFFWYGRRRKIIGLLCIDNSEYYTAYLIGKDELSSPINKFGEFFFKNLKEDSYELNIADASGEVVLSGEIFTRGKKEEMFTPFTSNGFTCNVTKKGKCLYVDINN